jgi:hypothetical protein
MLFTKTYWNNKNKEVETGGTYSTHWGDKYTVVVRRYEGTRPLERLR